MATKRVKHQVKHLTHKIKNQSFKKGSFSKKQLTIFAAVFAIVGGYVIFRSFAAGATYYVATNGSDANPCSQAQPCLSFNRAYQVASPGDTVEVAGGTYAGQLLSYDSSKTSQDDVIFRPASGATVNINDTSPDGKTIQFGRSNGSIMGARHVTIKDMNLADEPYLYPGTQDVTLDGITARKFYMRCVHDVTVINSQFSHPEATGVPTIGAADVIAIPSSASSLCPSASTPSKNIVIENTKFYRIWRPQGNTTFHVECLHIMGVDGLYVRKSQFIECLGNTSAISLNLDGSDTMRNVVIENNFFWKTYSGGSYPQPTGEGPGINMSADPQGHEVLIRNNTFVDSGDIVEQATPTGNGIIIESNIFDSIPSCGLQAPNYIWRYNISESGTWNSNCDDGNNTVGAVSFVNRDTGDLRLAAGSFAIDKGNPNSYPSQDIDGNSRPSGSAPDAGAHEYGATSSSTTVLGIQGEKFTINGTATYPGRTNVSLSSGGTASIEGMLLNSRMINGVFDDDNSATRSNWAYPSGPAEPWNPTRHTNELVDMLDDYKAKGLNMITVGLQGGNPASGVAPGNGSNPSWIVSAYNSDGSLKDAWMDRLALVVERADQLGMTVNVSLFYQRQKQRLTTPTNEVAAQTAVDNITDWLVGRGYKNTMVGIQNEVGSGLWSGASSIWGISRAHELIERAKTRHPSLIVGTGMRSDFLPTAAVISASDYVSFSGNTHDIAEQEAYIDNIKAMAAWQAKPKPILVIEDGPRPATEKMDATLRKGVSFGYHDDGPSGQNFSNYNDGFQWVPANWTINTSAKQEFFNRVLQYTGGGTTTPPPPSPTPPPPTPTPPPPTPTPPPSSVTVSLNLINASNNTVIAPLTDGYTINLATNSSISVQALPSASVGSIRFTLDGSVFRTENSAPYALNGDTSGNYNPWTPGVGSHTLKVDAFSGSSASGSIIGSTTVNFTVTDSGSSPPPAPTPPPPSPPPTTKTGDLNNDTKVDIFDLSILLSRYNTSDATADINKDNIVNVFDLSILLSNYGK